ncbi:hypothetical protein AFLA_000102, partial [Aspergillus flavus NRRL3357]
DPAQRHLARCNSTIGRSRAVLDPLSLRSHRSHRSPRLVAAVAEEVSLGIIEAMANRALARPLLPREVKKRSTDVKQVRCRGNAILAGSPPKGSLASFVGAARNHDFDAVRQGLYREEYDAATTLIASLIWSEPGERPQQAIDQLNELNVRIRAKNPRSKRKPDYGTVDIAFFSKFGDDIDKAALAYINNKRGTNFSGPESFDL